MGQMRGRGPLAMADAVWFSRAGAWWRAATAEGARAVFPAACVGCGDPASPWCPDCDARLAAALARPGLVDDLAELDVLAPRTPAPVLAAGRYSGVVASAILAAKTRHGRRLLARMAPAMSRLVACVPADVGLVPVPPAPGSVSRRGFAPVAELLRHVRPRPATLPWLAARRRPFRSAGAQKAADRRHRGTEVRGRFTLRGAPRPGAQVVLVDDVMTSGATLAECARVLRGAGITVRGALVLARVPDPHGDHDTPGTTSFCP